MKLSEIKDLLECEVLHGADSLEEDVSYACACDLMSDVLAFLQRDSVLLTGLVNIQSVRTAYIANTKAIIYVRGKKPDEETIKLAREKNIPVMTTNLRLYDASGKLYTHGLRNIEEEVKKPSMRQRKG